MSSKVEQPRTNLVQAAVVEAPPEVKEEASTTTPNFASLPTSADSDELLRIRHSVRRNECIQQHRHFPANTTSPRLPCLDMHLSGTAQHCVKNTWRQY